MAFRAGIAERRLKPLWDAIDHRQYKSALKLASGLLTKHPDSAYLLTLKALVLERLGKPEEATALCYRAKAAGPVDDITLTTLQTVLQRLNRLEAATECFEQACAKCPDNVELQTALFNCYVRQYAYIKQQQVAMKLYKLCGEERYLMWAICSIMLQVGECDGKLLQLAEALLRKRLESHGLQDVEGLLVYLEVLKRQQKHEVALKLLQGPSGDLFTIVTDRLHLQGELLIRSHQYRHATQVIRELLKSSSDDWAGFQMYVDAMLNSSPGDMGNRSLNCVSEDEMEDMLQQVISFINELQSMDVLDMRRMPYLATLEVEKRRILWISQRVKEHQETPDTLSDNLAQSIVKYFKRFGSMASFASDVLEFVQHVQGDQKVGLVNGLRQVCLDLPCATPPVKALRFSVAAFQVEGQLGLKAAGSDADLVTHAAEVGQLYLKCVELSIDLDPQESMLGEELLALIIDHLVQLYLRTKQLAYVVEAVLVLELGLSFRRFNAQYKILLVSLYGFLSAIKPAWTWYKTVDVKYILLESMSHHILPSLLSSLQWDALESTLQDISKFHDDYQREAADLIILAYRHGTYSKVLEFVAFKERLERSHQLMVVRIEFVMLSLKRKADNFEEIQVTLSKLDKGRAALEWVTEIRLKALSFNEDLQTRPWWTCAPDECLLTGASRSVGNRVSQHGDDCKELQRKREVRWRNSLTLRCLLPRMLQLALTVISPNREADQTVVLELNELLRNYAELLGIHEEDLGAWLSDAVSSNFKELEPQVELGEMLTVALFWTATQHFSGQHISNHIIPLFSDCLRLVIKLVEASLEDALQGLTTECKILAPGSSLAKLVRLSTETIAWVGLCLQAWTKQLQPVSKKKKQTEVDVGPALLSVIEVLHSAISTICSLLELCSNRVHEFLIRLEEVDLLLLDEAANMDPGPGHVIRTLLKGLPAGAAKPPEKWQPRILVNHMVKSQRETLVGIKDSFLLRLKSLKAIKL